MASAFDQVGMGQRCELIDQAAAVTAIAIRHPHLDELLLGQRSVELLELRVGEAAFADSESGL